MRKRLKLATLTALSVLFAASIAHAATFNWTGAGVGSNLHLWDRQQNWTGGPPTEHPDDFTDIAIFATVTGGSTTPLINVPISVGTITYNANAQQFTIGGSSTLTPGAGGIANNSSVQQIINVPVLVTTSQSWSSPSANTFFNQGVTLSSGVLTIGPNIRIPTTANLNFSGGGLTLGDVTAPLLNSPSGIMNLTSNGSIDLTDNGINSEVWFEGATRAPGTTLTVNNWQGVADPNIAPTAGTGDRIFITHDPGADFLANVIFTGYNENIPGAFWFSDTKELVPVPEPHEYAAIFALGLLGFAIYRRRMTAALQAT